MQLVGPVLQLLPPLPPLLANMINGFNKSVARGYVKDR